jgi:hypothetical protein
MTEVLYLVIAYGFKCVANMLMASTASKALHEKVKSTLLDKLICYHPVYAVREALRLEHLHTGFMYFPKECVLNSLSENEYIHFVRDKFHEFKPRPVDFHNWQLALIRPHDGVAAIAVVFDPRTQKYLNGIGAIALTFRVDLNPESDDKSIHTDGIANAEYYVTRTKRPKLHPAN